MKKALAILVAIGLAGTLLLVFSFIKEQEPEKKVFLERGERAPAFSLVDVRKEELKSLEELLEEGPLYIIFWSSSCVSCKDGMEAIEQAYRRYARKGFRVVGINIYQQKEEVLKFIEEVGITFPVLLDREGETVDGYGIYFVPLSYVISSDARVLDLYAGNPTQEDLKEMIEKHWLRASQR